MEKFWKNKLERKYSNPRQILSLPEKTHMMRKKSIRQSLGKWQEMFMKQLDQTARKTGNHDRKLVFQPETQLAKVEK